MSTEKTGWQAIEYAPLDGTKVDLLLNGVWRIPDCFFDYPDGYEEIEENRMWITDSSHHPVVMAWDPFNEITHFANIPKIPTH
ncbi:MAG: hypothetical protein GY835_00065 [bacterium]|nr:hypothetical protein [bacterium]